MTIILSGTIGQSGLGGQAWALMQYLLGLRGLGHEVFYLEDCGEYSYIYDWQADTWTFDLDVPAGYVRSCLDSVGLGDRWIYRAGTDSRGMSSEAFRQVCSEADLLIIRALPLLQWREEYDLPGRRVFIDVDPGFTQMKVANGDSGFIQTLDRCDHLFTIGQRIGASDCPIPSGGYHWHTSLPPVWLEEWPVVDSPPEAPFTSIIRWRGFHEVEHQGITYRQRDASFMEFLDLPGMVSRQLMLAIVGQNLEFLRSHGWATVSGLSSTRTPGAYQDFIQRSHGEFSVPKHGYTSTRGGWFSDRSVCYLASGKPVLVQDTGLADWLPVGKGVVTFENVEGAVKGIEAIDGEYHDHRIAARRLAEDYFNAAHVLPRLIDVALN